MIFAISDSTFLAGLSPIIVGMLGIFAALIRQRTSVNERLDRQNEHLATQDNHVQEIHVLVNQRLTDALRVGQLLAEQLVENNIVPVAAPEVIPPVKVSKVSEVSPE